MLQWQIRLKPYNPLVLNLRQSKVAVSTGIGCICQMEVVLCHLVRKPLRGKLLEDLEWALYQTNKFIYIDARITKWLVKKGTFLCKHDYSVPTTEVSYLTFSLFNPDVLIMYWHSLGTSYQLNKCMIDWVPTRMLNLSFVRTSLLKINHHFSREFWRN